MNIDWQLVAVGAFALVYVGGWSAVFVLLLRGLKLRGKL